MDRSVELRSGRVWFWAAAVVGAAFAWIFLSLALGFGSLSARADDGGLLSGATSAVDTVASQTVDTASSAVASATTVVSSTAAAVAPPAPAPAAPAPAPAAPAPAAQVPAPQPAAAVAAPAAVVTTVTDAAATVVGTVQSAVDQAPVSAVVDAAVAAPVVSTVAPALGLDEPLAQLAGTVDQTASGTVVIIGAATGAVVDTIGTVTDTVGTPTLPGLPGLGVIPTANETLLGAAGSELSTATTASIALGELSPLNVPSQAGAASISAAGALAPLATASAVVGSVLSAPVSGLLHLFSDGLAPSAPATSSSSGTGLGVGAVLMLGFIAAHRAWVRRSAPGNEDVPGSPLLGTDVSPD